MIHLGYYIRRTYKAPAHTLRGKTMCAFLHTLYSTEVKAARALKTMELHKRLDGRFTYSIVPVHLKCGCK
jgi:hypothetical protein